MKNVLNPISKSDRLNLSLSRLHIAILEHYLQYDANSPSGLIWRESSAYCIKIGSVAGTVNNLGYWEVVVCGHRYKCHHIVLLMHDNWPKAADTEADHLDRNKSNNSIANLRWTSRSENCMNKLACGTSPYKYATKYKHKWMAKWRMPNQGKYMFAGYYGTDYDAHCAAISHRNQVLGRSDNPMPRESSHEN